MDPPRDATNSRIEIESRELSQLDPNTRTELLHATSHR